MRKREEGFTLVELMITMVIFVMAIAAASTVFTSLLTQFKQQSKIAETNVEGIVGLAILKHDIESAGYGLFWNPSPLPVNYTESNANPFNLNDAPNNPPRGIASADNAAFAPPNTIFDGSDYLVIRALNVTRNDTSEKWTVVKDPSVFPYASPYNPREWTPTGENFNATDRVIVFAGATKTVERSLITSGGAFYTTYSNVTSDPWQPQDIEEARLVYGINSPPVNAPVRPFNRADYYIARPATIPGRCAPNTGILYKATMIHDTGGTFVALPLLDCVADMQVIYALDRNNDGTLSYSTELRGNLGVPLNAAEVRDQLREVRVYILAHEGQMDRDNKYPNATLTYPDAADPRAGLGRTFDFASAIGPDYAFYRWKLYTLAIKPLNLR
jgi:prepilin-type N-terminal cleavage/methylation domain-containing protein